MGIALSALSLHQAKAKSSGLLSPPLSEGWVSFCWSTTSTRGESDEGEASCLFLLC